MAGFKKISEMDLEKATGGQGGYDSLHDLSCFVQKTVCNVVNYDSTACLTLRRSPNGEIIPNIGWQNGEPILVHGSYTENGWFLAYKNGMFGYVNPNFVG